MEYYEFSETIIKPLRSSLGHIAVAYFLYKVATPARYAVTLGGTTFAIKFLSQRGIIKPMPSRDQMVKIYQDKKLEMKERVADKKQEFKDKVADKKQEFRDKVEDKKQEFREKVNDTKQELRDRKQDFQDKYMKKEWWRLEALEGGAKNANEVTCVQVRPANVGKKLFCSKINSQCE